MQQTHHSSTTGSVFGRQITVVRTNWISDLKRPELHPICGSWIERQHSMTAPQTKMRHAWSYAAFCCLTMLPDVMDVMLRKTAYISAQFAHEQQHRGRVKDPRTSKMYLCTHIFYQAVTDDYLGSMTSGARARENGQLPHGDVSPPHASD